YSIGQPNLLHVRHGLFTCDLISSLEQRLNLLTVAPVDRGHKGQRSVKNVLHIRALVHVSCTEPAQCIGARQDLFLRHGWDPRGRLVFPHRARAALRASARRSSAVIRAYRRRMPLPFAARPPRRPRRTALGFLRRRFAISEESNTQMALVDPIALWALTTVSRL